MVSTNTLESWNGAAEQFSPLAMVGTETLSGTTSEDRLAPLVWLAEQGARFTLPAPGSKVPGYGDWPEQAYGLAEAQDHARAGGNVGLLTGAPSGGLVVVDLDHDFAASVAKLGGLAHTAKVVRDNAPERGKLLYQVVGELPPNRKWSPQPDDHQPWAELLSTGRHALMPPSEYDGGRYRLVDSTCGVFTVSPETLAWVWWLLTGEELYAEASVVAPSKAPSKLADDDLVACVMAAWPTLEVFRHFGRAAHGERREGDEVRLLENGGLLVNDWRWYCHSEGIGGNQIDAWYYCTHGCALDHADSRAFRETVYAMAEAASIPLPEVAAKLRRSGRGPSDSTGVADGSDDSGTSSERNAKQYQADLLWELATANAEIFTAQDGKAYAFVPLDEKRRACYALDSKLFAGWLTALYRAEYGRIPSRQALQDAAEALAFDAREVRRDVYVRVGSHAGKVYIDLGTEEWNAIEVDGEGWRIVDQSPVAFRRSASTKPLPLPQPGVSLHTLQTYLNIEPEDWPLVAAWAVAALNPHGPYPILAPSR